MSEIKPALTADEWERGYDSEDLTGRLRNSMATEGPRVDVVVRAHPLGGGLGDERDLHALAALALHGQPFGFTWEDVDAARKIGRDVDDTIEGHQLVLLADRIAALLPPRDE